MGNPEIPQQAEKKPEKIEEDITASNQQFHLLESTIDAFRAIGLFFSQKRWKLILTEMQKMG